MSHGAACNSPRLLAVSVTFCESRAVAPATPDPLPAGRAPVATYLYRLGRLVVPAAAGSSSPSGSPSSPSSGPAPRRLRAHHRLLLDPRHGVAEGLRPAGGALPRRPRRAAPPPGSSCRPLRAQALTDPAHAARRARPSPSSPARTAGRRRQRPVHHRRRLPGRSHRVHHRAVHGAPRPSSPTRPARRCSTRPTHARDAGLTVEIGGDAALGPERGAADGDPRRRRRRRRAGHHLRLDGRRRPPAAHRPARGRHRHRRHHRGVGLLHPRAPPRRCSP